MPDVPRDDAAIDDAAIDGITTHGAETLGAAAHRGSPNAVGTRADADAPDLGSGAEAGVLAGDVDPGAPGDRSAHSQLADPWEGDPRLPSFFGDAWPAVEAFHRLLVDEGELRGLIGPRELPRLWERHLLNSAAVVPFLPAKGLIVDVGSGAGLPGVVIAAMLPEASVVLVEPMERRVVWLHDVVDRTGLSNVEVRRARAQELEGALEADAVTARAVASLDKLFRWTAPLVREGGTVLAMKGARAADELVAAAKAMRAAGLTDGQVHEATTIAGTEPTRVVSAVRGRGPRVR